MKKDFVLSKAHLSYWLRQLRKTADLIAPSRSENNGIIFSSIENIHEIALDCPASIPSPKEFLFPQKEEMFRFSGKGVVDSSNSEKRIIFGVRSCDISAIALLDRFYGGSSEDNFYMQRRRNTAFISIACGTPDPTCFCAGLGSGPFLKSGFDMQLTDLGDRYLAEVDSEKGLAVVRGFGHIFRKPVKADYDDQYEVLPG